MIRPAERDEVHGEELIQRLLQQVPHLPPRSIEWRLEQGTLVLRGRVTSFYQKQMAQTAARRMPGVQRIVNELEVEDCSVDRLSSHDDTP